MANKFESTQNYLARCYVLDEQILQLGEVVVQRLEVADVTEGEVVELLVIEQVLSHLAHDRQPVSRFVRLSTQQDVLVDVSQLVAKSLHRR